ncbi:MAG: ribosome maturation factor RimM [Propionibacteriaceae bacterium]|jgi:16S rRNA processing protein RimM|nr:ribosome maturation factor RimM [Propionibacteriaceae bacterium]
MIEVRLGTVRRVHGLAGDVVVDSHTDVSERRFVPGAAMTAVFPGSSGGPLALTVAAARRHSGRLLVRFSEASDRSSAETLLGADLMAQADPAEPAGGPEEFFDRQLRGLAVFDSAGRAVGQVGDVLHLPAQDLIVVETSAGERLVPFVAALVPDVDLAAGRLTVADLPGLLDGQELEAVPGEPSENGPAKAKRPSAASAVLAAQGEAAREERGEEAEGL